MPEIRAARFADALALADRLRFEDAREIAASWEVGTREGLFRCLLQSDRAFALLEGGRVDALWGITALQEGGLEIGVPWMLAAERLFESHRPFLEQSRRVIRHLLLDHDVLTNLTDADNQAHLRWLEFCGFHRLRRHERRGPAGRSYVEFYQINARRHPAPAAVLAVLERRSHRIAPIRRCDPAMRLVNLGLALLDRRVEPVPALAGELANVVKELEEHALASNRMHRTCTRLLLEIAVLVGERSNRQIDRILRRHTPLGELLAALRDIADLLVLEPGADGAELVLALTPSKAPAAASGLPAANEAPAADDRQSAAGRESTAAARPVRAGGIDAFNWLIRRHVRALTLDGRVRRTHGHRLWSAAIGGGQGTAGLLGLERDEVWQLMRDHRLVAALGTGGDATIAALRERRRALLLRSVGHAVAIAGMRASCAGPDRVSRAVTARLDRWPLCAPAELTGGMRVLGDVMAVASFLADHVAAALLPDLRVGGVTSGYGDRHWLYRLLWHRLVLAATGCSSAELETLLIEDVIGLVLAGRLEDRLLLGDTATPSTTELEALLREALAFWQADLPTVEAPGYLVALLMPALALPAVHAVQLPAALVAWHLAAVGGLESGLRRLGEAATDDVLASRRPFRNVLRSLARGVDGTTLSRHLGMSADAEDLTSSGSAADGT